MSNVLVHSLLTEYDVTLLRMGKHFRLYQKLGSHLMVLENQEGCFFAVWAPNATYVSVIGDFNFWGQSSHPLNIRWDGTGIWEGFIPGIKKGDVYKYFMKSVNGAELEKGDPYAMLWEVPPRTASVVWETGHTWKDKKWMTSRAVANSLAAPLSIYEVHMGSWKLPEGDSSIPMTYTEMAEQMVPYIQDLGFTHVEFMPVMEHPYGGSWGYQQIGYFAPTSRFGKPEEFMALVDAFHNAGIGVILDWVPSHFPYDAHGLFRFDGTALYEHEDWKKGYHPDWNSYIFNYGRNEVRSFLTSSALYWFDLYHVDALRVDAVASILYLDYSRKEGEWIPNMYGGRENLEAISWMQELNEEVYRSFPDVQMIAEESTSYPGVSKPVYTGGLGYGLKWMMGWMNDTLTYFQTESVYRKYHHHNITFSLVYAFSENFMLPLSHDEVVHGKGSLLTKMPGDNWQKFANLRLLYSYMFTHPGSKLLFMGAELAQTNEWRYEGQLDWHLLEHESHKGVQNLIKDLNGIYKSEKGLYENNYDPSGFEWIDLHNADQSVLVYMRKGNAIEDTLIVACNFTPVPHNDYRIGVIESESWKEILNSDDSKYWGSGLTQTKAIKTEAIEAHGRQQSISISLPPLGVTILKITPKKAKPATAKKTSASSKSTPATKKTTAKTGAKKTATKK